MLMFLTRRVAGLIATLAVASVIVFGVLEVLPGDPAQIMLGTEAREDTLAALRAQMGLDRPVAVRYLDWIGGVVTGDLGVSYTYKVPVSDLVVERLPITIPLSILSILISTAIAIPAGVYAASRHGKAGDAAVIGATQIGVSIPNFWIGILFIMLFAVTLRWVPAGGFPGWGEGVWPALRALLMPAFALGLAQAAVLARVTRSAVLETLGEDYIRTARAKGLTRRAALWGHAVRNALIPVVTIMGLQFSFLISGTITIETVFSLPGLGRLAFQALAQRDLIVVESVVLLFAAMVIFVNFVVDLVYGLLDPRLRGGADGL